MDWLAPISRWMLPIGATLLVTAAVLWIMHRALPKDPATNVLRQLINIAVVVLSMVAVALVLPVDSDTRGQLLSLYGLVITAVIALSSTTFVSNAMAGLALRAVGGFKPGDFIRVGEHFGRVTEKALLHTEMQNEERDLVTLPNLFLMNQPVRVVRSTGTLISANVSLGYDVDRRMVREVLKQAATDAELQEPFVQILELGDHAVTYRICGFLEDLSNLISKRTDLRSTMLDALHGANIEIVSPNFINQRRLESEQMVIPTVAHEASVPEDDHAEKLMFEKADVVARTEHFRQQRDELIEQVKELEQADADGNALEIRWRQRQIETLDEMLTTLDID